MGVEYFYLYNHRSNDDYHTTLNPYILAGIVELKNVTTAAHKSQEFVALQCKCYTECLTHAKGVSKWIAFIDLDEFLFAVNGAKLQETLKDYEDFGGQKLFWGEYR
jgi:Glycosyltransferase family 92